MNRKVSKYLRKLSLDEKDNLDKKKLKAFKKVWLATPWNLRKRKAI